MYRLLALLVGLRTLAFCGSPLTTAVQVHSLPVEQARKGDPVVLKGTITHVMPEWSGFSLQDATDGVYISAWVARAMGLKPGQMVEVQGHTAAGNFAPMVIAAQVRVLGEGPLPPARRVTWQKLATGACDNDYVEVEGIVRSAGMVEPPAWEWRSLALRLDLGGNLIWAYLRDPGPLAQARLADSTVRIHGVCLVFTNVRRQFLRNTLLIPSADEFRILQPGPLDPFAVPLQPINAVFGFNTGSPSFHRVKVQGAVTLQVAGGLYIQQGNDGMLVRTESASPVRPGDRVEVVGFPAAGSFSTVLEDALVRVTGHASEPAARWIRADQVLVRNTDRVPASPDAVLLRMEGTLLDRAASAEDESLILQDGATLFTARVAERGGKRALASLAPGSRLAVTGVSAVQMDERGRPRSFELLMRSPSDVQVLAKAPWLTRARALRIAGGLLGLVIAAAVWVMLLHRRVRQQTEALRGAHEELEQRVRDRTSELVEAGESLRASERRFRLAVENFPYIFVIYDDERRIQFINENGVRLSGLSKDAILGRCDEDLFPPSVTNCYLPVLRRCAETRTVQSTECDVNLPSGSVRLIMTYVPILNHRGELAQILGITHDITERKRLQEQLHHSQKLEAVGLLAGGVAHDFNNMLAVIIGYAQLLEDELAPGPLRERVQEMLKAAERNAALTRQLLAFSRRQTLEPQVIDLNASIRGIEKMLRRLVPEDIALETALDPELGSVRVDPGQMEQIVMNLVLNARDAMPDGGCLRITTRNIRLDDAFVAGHPGAQAGEHAVLEVSDTGQGMDPETLRRIFEPFFTTKALGKGSGLGLATVYGIVKQSDGYIDAQSELGIGSRFCVYLPRVEAKPAPGRRQEQGRADHGDESILLVEDEQAVRTLMRDVLRAQGYTVLEAADGEEALEICEREAGRLQLLIADVVMPKLGGRELAARVADRWESLKVLLISGYGSPVAANTAYLQKPFTIEVLARKVRQVLDIGSDSNQARTQRTGQ